MMGHRQGHDVEEEEVDDDDDGDDSDNNNNIKLWQTSRVQVEYLSTAFANAFHNPLTARERLRRLQRHNKGTGWWPRWPESRETEVKKARADQQFVYNYALPSIHPQ